MAASLTKYSALLFLFSVMLGSFTPVNAVQVNKIYSASVPIASQQKRDRLAGFDQALSIVLVKASGQYAEVTRVKFIKALLPAEPLVQTFSYRENPAYQSYLDNQAEQEEDLAEENSGESTQNRTQNSAEDSAEQSLGESLDESTVPPLPYILDVSFASSTVEEKMANHGLAVWGSVRPSVLVWLAYERNGERSILGTSDAGELVENLLLLGEERGIPLYLPVADLQDFSAVAIDDLWGLFPESVDQASKRYRADSVAMMRVYQSDSGLWSGNWSLNLKQVFEEGAHYDSTLPNLVEAFVTELAAKLSSHYAISKIPGEEGKVFNLEVDQVDTFADYIEIQQYLESLPPVENIEMNRVLSGRVNFKVTLVGSKNQFFEHVDLGGRLKKDLRERPLLESSLDSSINSSAELNIANAVFPDSDVQTNQSQEERVFLFQSTASEQNIYIDETEYYIWSSGNSLLLDKSSNTDKE